MVVKKKSKRKHTSKAALTKAMKNLSLTDVYDPIQVLDRNIARLGMSDQRNPSAEALDKAMDKLSIGDRRALTDLDAAFARTTIRDHDQEMTALQRVFGNVSLGRGGRRRATRSRSRRSRRRTRRRYR